MSDFDIIIAGAGPAGCAAAISLADFAPNLRVCLIDPGTRADKIGDTVPPSVTPVLRHLGLWDRFVADGHLPAYRSRSTWGQREVVANEYLLRGGGSGWQLDRTAFDQALLDRARSLVTHFTPDKVVGLVSGERRLRVLLKQAAGYSARYAIDATGRTAVLTTLAGGRNRVEDRLVAGVTHVADRHAENPELFLETFPDGWWYTALLPHGRRIVACMTDADQVRQLELGAADGFSRCLRETRHLRALLDPVECLKAPRFFAAGWRRPAVNSGEPVLPVGDAALALDPVCGQGIVNALRTGIFASYAVADWLRRGAEDGVRKYRTLIYREAHAYRAALRDFYVAEARWPERPFWRRRQAA